MDTEALIAQAQKELSESASATTDIPWHRWSEDDTTVIGVLSDQGTFNSREGEVRHFAVITKEDGSRVRVGTDNAALRRLWDEKNPQTGDTLCIMRGTEMRESSSGRQFWPYALAVESAQTVMNAGIDPDDDAPF